MAERKDLLAAGFAFATLWAYAGWVRRGGTWRYAAALGLFALGLLAKPMLVTLPFVLLLLDVAARTLAGRRARANPREAALPRARRGFVGRHVLRAARRRRVRPGGGLSFAARVGNAFQSYASPGGRRFGRGAVRVPSAPALDAPGSAWPPGAWLGLAFVAGRALLVRSRRRAPRTLVGWLWFLGTLVPVLGLVQVGAQGWAERYTYIPTIGLLLMLVWSADALAAARGQREARPRARRGRVRRTRGAERAPESGPGATASRCGRTRSTSTHALTPSNMGEALELAERRRGQNDTTGAAWSSRPRSARALQAGAPRAPWGRIAEARADLEKGSRSSPISARHTRTSAGCSRSRARTSARSSTCARPPRSCRTTSRGTTSPGCSRPAARAPEEALAIAEACAARRTTRRRASSRPSPPRSRASAATRRPRSGRGPRARARPTRSPHAARRAARALPLRASLPEDSLKNKRPRAAARSRRGTGAASCARHRLHSPPFPGPTSCMRFLRAPLFLLPALALLAAGCPARTGRTSADLARHDAPRPPRDVRLRGGGLPQPRPPGPGLARLHERLRGLELDAPDARVDVHRQVPLRPRRELRPVGPAQPRRGIEAVRSYRARPIADDETTLAQILADTATRPAGSSPARGCSSASAWARVSSTTTTRP